ncbi:MAG TPA: glycosyltransferase family 39 protein [Chloroflexota bacterium]|nr:glycosyltransferase family 39 protein [Chloroflexota bacterium]
MIAEAGSTAVGVVARRRANFPSPGVWTVVGVILVLAAAVAIRLSLLIRSGWLLEGDDSLSTLMGLAILDGDRPIMLKNQTYAAAWEPYAMALSYSFFGVSRVAAKLPALLGSLVLIGVTAWLAREVAGRPAAWFAALLVAVPPAYPLVLWLKPWAPYTEVILFGTVCLVCAIRLAWPRPGQRDGLWSLGCGIAAGLTLWMHPLAVWYLAAAALTLLARVRGGRRWLNVSSLGLLGFGIGGLPIWVFNLQTAGATVRFVLSGTQGQSADRAAVLAAWWNNDLPRGAGLWHPWGDSPAALGFVMAVVLGAAVAWAVLGRFVSLDRGRPRPVFGRRCLTLRPRDTALLLLALMPTFLVLSGFGGPALNPYGFDATGRYTPPIWSTLAVILGAGLAALWRWRHTLAIAVAVVPVALNLAAVNAINPVQAFQSPYWDRLPVDNGPLLNILRAEGVHYIWLNHWASQAVMFDARAEGEPLIAYDWYDVAAGGIDRFPEYRLLVERAARPAFVLVTDEAEPALEHTLRQMGVSFLERRAAPYVVVIPMSRTVHPSEVTSALDYRY